MIRPIHFLPVLAMVYAISQLPAHAQTTVGSSAFNGFMATITGNSATVGVGTSGTLLATQAPTALGGSSGWSYAGNFGISGSASGVSTTANATLPLAGANIPISGTSKINAASLGKAVGKLIFKVAVPVQAALGLAEFAKDIGVMLRDKDGYSEWYSTSTSTSGPTPTMRWSRAGAEDYRFDAEGACRYASQFDYYKRSFTGLRPYPDDPSTQACIGVDDQGNSGAYGNINGQMMCNTPNGWVTAQRKPDYSYTCGGTSTETKETILTEDDLAKRVADKSGALPSEISQARLAALAANAIKAGITMGLEPAKVTGPASLPSTTDSKEKVLPDGTKVQTDTTTEKKVAYDGDKVTVTPTVTTKTTTTKPDGTKTTETTTETETAKQTSEPAPTDTALPELPKLYERKYPDGIEGVWKEKSAELKTSPVMNLAKTMFPQVSGGTCPRITLPLEFASWANFGTADISPDCAIWGFGRLIIVCSALLLARSLIFGG